MVIDTPNWLLLKSPKISGNSVVCLQTLFTNSLSWIAQLKSHLISQDVTKLNLFNCYLWIKIIWSALKIKRIHLISNAVGGNRPQKTRIFGRVLQSTLFSGTYFTYQTQGTIHNYLLTCAMLSSAETLAHRERVQFCSFDANMLIKKNLLKTKNSY